MSSVVDQEFWDEQNAGVELDFDPEALNFRDLFDRYLEPGGSCFEVGCYPGRFLVYLCRRFGYTANGIDRTPLVKTRLREFLFRNGVSVGQLFCEDFETFPSDREYDVVTSFGFIEHFENVEEVLKKHISLVKVGGVLVLACPNFRGLQYVFHRVFDADNLRRHHIPAMDLRRWRRVLRDNGMRVLHDGYYRTAEFWMHSERPDPFRESVGGSIIRVAKRLDERVRFPTWFLSPFLVSISRKLPPAGEAGRN